MMFLKLTSCFCWLMMCWDCFHSIWPSEFPSSHGPNTNPGNRLSPHGALQGHETRFYIFFKKITLYVFFYKFIKGKSLTLEIYKIIKKSHKVIFFYKFIKCMDLEDFEVLVVLGFWGTLWTLPKHWITYHRSALFTASPREATVCHCRASHTTTQSTIPFKYKPPSISGPLAWSPAWPRVRPRARPDPGLIKRYLQLAIVG